MYRRAANTHHRGYTHHPVIAGASKQLMLVEIVLILVSHCENKVVNSSVHHASKGMRIIVESQRKPGNAPKSNVCRMKRQCVVVIFFCLDGNCHQPSAAINDEFEMAVSALSAVSAGINELDDDMHIYSGEAMACTETPVGFKNCCADKGWGLDLGLASCKPQEQQLGQAKEKGLVVYVGRFCAERLLGICTRHKQGYLCV